LVVSKYLKQISISAVISLLRIFRFEALLVLRGSRVIYSYTGYPVTMQLWLL